MGLEILSGVACVLASRWGIAHDASVKLKRIRVCGFRSFAPEPGVELPDLGPMNVIVGPNNVGKSNLLRFLTLLRASLQGTVFQAQEGSDFERMLALGCRASEPDSWLHQQGRIHAELHVEVPESLCSKWPSNVFTGQRTLRISVSMTFRYASQVDLELNLLLADGSRLLEKVDGRVNLRTHMRGLTPDPRADDPMMPIPGIVGRLLADRILDIQALRHHSRGATEENRFSSDGADTVRALEKLSHDTLSRSRWGRVRRDLIRWLKILLNDPGVADILIKNNQLFIRLERAGTDLELALDELGTGAAQFVMLLAFLRLNDDTPRLVLIEEPEAHLHPAAVLELLRVVQTNIGHHQFIITTHSTSLLDAAEPSWRVFRAAMTEGATSIRPLTTTSEQLGLLGDLGVRPSQLFLANALVWVEGPSDVVYLRRLLRDAAASNGSTAIEGRSYTFVTYGGAVIAHLGIDPDDDRLVQSLRVSPNNVVVCDRDRDATAPLKPHVQRLIDEAKSLGQAVHVLPAREVENLLDPQVLCEGANSLVKRARIEDKDMDLRFTPESLSGEARFHEELASGAKLLNGESLPPDATSSIAARIVRKKTALAQHICTQPTRIFSDEALEFGSVLLDAIG